MRVRVETDSDSKGNMNLLKKNLRLITVCLASARGGLRHCDFTPYVGEQQKWPTTRGAFVTTINSYDRPGRSGSGKQYTLPCYFAPPNRPYIVLGSVDVDTPVGRLFEGSAQTTTLKPAVRTPDSMARTLLSSSVKTWRRPAIAR